MSKCPCNSPHCERVDRVECESCGAPDIATNGDPCYFCGAVDGVRPAKTDVETPFWKNVRELAAMRERITPERRALSGVRRAMREDTKKDEP